MSSASGAQWALLAIAVVAMLSALPAAIASSKQSKDCTYTIYTRTGSVWRAQTYSTITVTLKDAKGNSVYIPSLGEWDNRNDHTPFQNGALDAFSGLHYCFEYPICAINITSDGEGSNSGWYLNYLEVTAVGAHLPCNQKIFEVERWLAYDTWPFSLEYIQDDCDKSMLQRPITPRRQEVL